MFEKQLFNKLRTSVLINTVYQQLDHTDIYQTFNIFIGIHGES